MDREKEIQKIIKAYGGLVDYDTAAIQVDKGNLYRERFSRSDKGKKRRYNKK